MLKITGTKMQLVKAYKNGQKFLTLVQYGFWLKLCCKQAMLCHYKYLALSRIEWVIKLQ